MSDVNDFSSDNRWSDNAAECPYCGARIPFITSRECASCAGGKAVAKESAVPLDRPTESFYSRLPMTPWELEEYRRKCAEIDRANRGEKVPEEVIEEAERLAYQKG